MAGIKKRALTTDKAPSAIGPYSQGVIVGSLMYSSGQIAIDPATNEFFGGTIEEQTEIVMRNLMAVLEAAGSSSDDVVKTSIYLKDMKDFGAVNQIYAKYFQNCFPARSCIEVAGLPKGALVEIELIALVHTT